MKTKWTQRCKMYRRKKHNLRKKRKEKNWNEITIQASTFSKSRNTTNQTTWNDTDEAFFLFDIILNGKMEKTKRKLKVMLK